MDEALTGFKLTNRLVIALILNNNWLDLVDNFNFEYKFQTFKHFLLQSSTLYNLLNFIPCMLCMNNYPVIFVMFQIIPLIFFLIWIIMVN